VEAIALSERRSREKHPAVLVEQAGQLAVVVSDGLSSLTRAGSDR
jgi:hypothetical protein